MERKTKNYAAGNKRPQEKQTQLVQGLHQTDNPTDDTKLLFTKQETERASAGEQVAAP